MVTDDRPSIAELQRATLAKRLDFLATMPMPPIVYPPLPMGLAADLVPTATRTPPLRPDGFDQSRIDMLKAAMLAPSVKVKR